MSTESTRSQFAMYDLLDEMKRLRVNPRTEYRPRLLSLRSAEDRKSISELIATGHITQIHDSIETQLEELFAIRNLVGKRGHCCFQDFRTELLDGEHVDYFGAWIFYAWTNSLVHILPKCLFDEVRTNRNQHKISSQE